MSSRFYTPPVGHFLRWIIYCTVVRTGRYAQLVRYATVTMIASYLASCMIHYFLNFISSSSFKRRYESLKAFLPETTPLFTMTTKRTFYGKIIERKMLEGTCASCLGVRDKELADEAVILCDGPGCIREFHLSCTDPLLTEVPEGNFYCMDCERDGTTRHLEQYFDRCADERSKFRTSREYVGYLIHRQMQLDADGDHRSDNKNSRADLAPDSKKRKIDQVDVSPVKLGPPPISELSRIAKLHIATMDDSRWKKVGKNNDGVSLGSSEPAACTITTDVFVGKTIKLYCPTDNQYHTGRIIDWRSAVGPGVEPEVAHGEFYGDGIHCSTEFLVRFKAGMNGRKKTLLQWMIFEEHSCAVSTSMVMALRDKGRGMNGWRPAQVLLRSGIELVPFRKLVSASDNFALVTFFGGAATSIYLDVRDDAVDICSKLFWEEFKQKTYASPVNRLKVNGVHSRTMTLAMNAMSIELQEQKRTIRWQSLPLKNFYHEKALTVIDEFSREIFLENDDFPTNIPITTSDGFPAPRLCPLIQRGVDKQWIAHRLSGVKGEQSLDSIPGMEVRRTRLPACVAVGLINCGHKTA